MGEAVVLNNCELFGEGRGNGEWHSTGRQPYQGYFTVFLDEQTSLLSSWTCLPSFKVIADGKGSGGKGGNCVCSAKGSPPCH